MSEEEIKIALMEAQGFKRVPEDDYWECVVDGWIEIDRGQKRPNGDGWERRFGFERYGQKRSLTITRPWSTDAVIRLANLHLDDRQRHQMARWLEDMRSGIWSSVDDFIEGFLRVKGLWKQ